MPPRVFISCRRGSRYHANRVLALADRLRADGVDVCLDRHLDPHPPERGPQHVRAGSPETELGHAHELVDIIAKVVHDSEGAKTLAKRAGFPPEHLPEFKTASGFWSIIVEQATKGKIDLKVLIEEVVKQFPYNLELAEYNERIARTLAFTGTRSSTSCALPATRALTHVPSEGWSAWAERQMIEADFVILVCTPESRRHSSESKDTPTGDHEEHWRATLAQAILCVSGSHGNKLIPVFLEDGTDQDLPPSLRPYTHYRLDVDYHALLHRLTNQLNSQLLLDDIREAPHAGRTEDHVVAALAIQSFAVPVSPNSIRTITVGEPGSSDQVFAARLHGRKAFIRASKIFVVGLLLVFGSVYFVPSFMERYLAAVFSIANRLLVSADFQKSGTFAVFLAFAFLGLILAAIVYLADRFNKLALRLGRPSPWRMMLVTALICVALSVTLVNLEWIDALLYGAFLAVVFRLKRWLDMAFPT